MELTVSAEIAAPIEIVRDQTNDIAHHIEYQVHKDLNLNSLSSTGTAQEYYQEIRLLGFRVRDKIHHSTLPDGSICLTYSGGLTDGAELVIRLTALGDSRTLVHQTFIIPVIGAKMLLAPAIRLIMQYALKRALREDRIDIEELGYPRQ